MFRTYGSRWFGGFLLVAGALLSAVTLLQMKVDPFDVWDVERVSGWNNYKIAQDETERVFKLYQYRNARPDVVFFGSSRVNYCTPAQWPGVEDDKVYNFGLNAVHIPEMKMYFDAAMKIHKPRRVMLAVDLLQFSSRYNEPREGFSADRLFMLSASPVTAFLFKMKEMVLSFDAMERSMETIDASRKNPGGAFYIRGWNSHALQAGNSSYRYRNLLWKYHRSTHRYFSWSQENYQLFAQVLKDAMEAGIKTVVVMNPESADFLMSYDAYGIRKQHEKLKRRLVQLSPVWDFNYVNPVTVNRQNYLDPSHYRPSTALRVLDVVSGHVSPSGDFGVLLTRDNVETELARQTGLFENWKLVNQQMVELLQNSSHWKKNDRNNRRFHQRAVQVLGR